ncbi:hypothetical protein [Phenylobacterium sp.]|uniref:hypothetical protein n=1 Tax=Phenylobacterium sp. TaxID=1871053 RepID=UPI002730644E|nr:hypothetical protein [Phenylobacterium sp.]MDP1617487.1 hypothetical protein [Phenylobacterium sp.]MDP1986775.1 hypothetical protein [Phenylobacterium sp.]
MLQFNKIPYPQKLVTRFAVCTAAKVTENDLTNAVLLYTVPAGAPALLTRLMASPNDDVTASRLKLYVCKAAAPTVPYLVMPALMTAAAVNETSAVAPTEFNIDEERPVTLEGGDLVYVASGVGLAVGIVFHGVFQLFEVVPA